MDISNTLTAQLVIVSPTTYSISLVLQSDNQPLVSNVCVINSSRLSDQDLVACDILRRYKPSPVQYTYRNIKQINVSLFQNSLFNSQLYTDPADNPDNFVQQLKRIYLTTWRHYGPAQDHVVLVLHAGSRQKPSPPNDAGSEQGPKVIMSTTGQHVGRPTS